MSCNTADLCRGCSPQSYSWDKMLNAKSIYWDGASSLEGAAGAAFWWRSHKMNSSSSMNWRPGDQCTITSSSLSELRSITSCNMFEACQLATKR